MAVCGGCETARAHCVNECDGVRRKRNLCRHDGIWRRFNLAHRSNCTVKLYDGLSNVKHYQQNPIVIVIFRSLSARFAIFRLSVRVSDGDGK